MERREFLAALAFLAAVPRKACAAIPYPVHFRKPNPYEGVLAHVEAGTDEFHFEKEAAEIEGRLVAMLGGQALPLSPDFEGAAPLPGRYRDVAEGVSEAEYGSAGGFPEGHFQEELAQWIRSLGRPRRARFFVLPDNLVRYEIASEGAYRTGLWKQVWQLGRLRSWHPVSETVTTASRPLFQDITGHSFARAESFHEQLRKGNTWWRSRLDAATGIDIYGNNGVAVGDIDGDGWDEIYVCQQAGLPNRLYKNRGDATFLDITEEAGVGVLDESTCALFVDFRNSGNQDLVVLGGAGPLLFINRGDGRFDYRPDAFRFRKAPQGVFTGMAAADYDRDGRVDLYLCTYLFFQSEDQYRYATPYHDAQNGPPNYLFRNGLTETGGYFDDATEESGMNDNNNRFSFAPAWCDFDGDGWPDLYVANDFGRSNLYRNRQGKFRDEAAAAGVENMAPGMSAAWFDYDGDGRPDLYVSNMWTAAGQRVARDAAFVPGRERPAEYRSHTKGNSLFRNTGDGRFAEMDRMEGVSMGRWAWCADGIDFDNDGTPEIFIATGMLTNSSEKDLDSFFWRQVVAKSPVTAVPAVDYENGWNAINQLIREDYSWCGHEPNVFYKRGQPADGSAARFHDFSGVSGLDFAEDSRAFAVTDIDHDGNLDIILKSRLGPQVRVLRNNCGVGRRAIALRLTGVESSRDAIGARVEANGRVYCLSAGSGYLSQHSKQLHIGLGEAAEADIKISWPSGRTQSFAKLRAGFCYRIREGSDEVKAAPFAARAAMQSAPVEAVNHAEFGATWLFEPVPLPEKRKGPGFVLLSSGTATAPVGVPFEIVDLAKAAPDLAAQYSIFHRYLFELRTDLELPLLLLIDGQSRAHKIYKGVPSAAVLQADFKALLNGPRPELALPFPGRYYLPPRRNYFKLGAAFYWAGYPDQAIPYLDEVVRRDPENWKALFALGQIHFDAERWQPALESYRKVLAIRPAHTGALIGAGEVYARMNDPQAAEKLLRQAVESDGKNADAANQLGLALAKQDRTSEAKEWFERAISIDPAHTGAINNLAVLFTKLGQTNDAISAFRYGIERAPDDETLYLNLGRLYLSMGERQKASEIMHQLLKRKPGNPVATRALRELDLR
jgi:tetratricopeptide (TPR) repeat protein